MILTLVILLHSQKLKLISCSDLIKKWRIRQKLRSMTNTSRQCLISITNTPRLNSNSRIKWQSSFLTIPAFSNNCLSFSQRSLSHQFRIKWTSSLLCNKCSLIQWHLLRQPILFKQPNLPRKLITQARLLRLPQKSTKMCRLPHRCSPRSLLRLTLRVSTKFLLQKKINRSSPAKPFNRNLLLNS